MSATIVVGDCRQVMPGHGPFDMIMADPPYGDTALDWDEIVKGWEAVALASLKPSGSMWVFGSMRYFMTTGIPSGWTLAQDIVWQKHNGSGMRKDRFRRIHEHAVHLYPAWQLARLWPDAKWPEAVRTKILAGSRDAVQLLQASYYDHDIRAWRYVVVCCEQAQPGETVWEGINRTNPWNVFRWWTTPDSPWGIGPLMLTLPDIMTANKAVEMILKAAAYALAPPLMVSHDGVVNPDTLRIAPHALIRVARTGGPMGSSIQPLEMNGRVDLAQLALQDVRQSIAQHTLSRQLPPESAAVRSPTEIVERMRDFAFDTGSAFGSLNYEYVPNIVSRVLDICDKKKIPGMDFEALKIDQLVLQVKITGPLARSQTLTDVESTVRYLELLKSIGGQELLTAIAKVEDLHKLASMMAVPSWVNREAVDRDKLLGAMGEAAAQGAGLPQAEPQGGQPQLSLVA